MALGSETAPAEAAGAVSRDTFHRIVVEHQRRIHRILLERWLGYHNGSARASTSASSRP
jgi:hypothetical protein